MLCPFRFTFPATDGVFPGKFQGVCMAGITAVGVLCVCARSLCYTPGEFSAAGSPCVVGGGGAAGRVKVAAFE